MPSPSPSLAEIARVATGDRPKYFEDSIVDDLLALLLEQAEENCVLQDRLTTAESLSPGIGKKIDDHTLTQGEASNRLAGHSESIGTLMRKIVSLMEASETD